MFKKLGTFAFVFICSFQMAFGAMISSREKAYHQYMRESDSLIQKLQSFNEAINGKDLPPECEKSEGSKPKCTSKKVPGLIDMIVARVLSNHKDGKNDNGLLEFEESVRQHYRTAKNLKDKLHRLLLARSLDPELKRSLLPLYIKNVSLSMRDLSIVLGNSGNRDLYENLMPLVPKSLYPELEDGNYNLDGAGRASTPFELLMFGAKAEYLLSVDFSASPLKGWGQLEFNEAEMVVRRDVGVLLKALTPQNYMTAIRMMTIFMMSVQIRNYESMVGYADSAQNRSVHIPQACQTKKNGSIPEVLTINFSEDPEKQKKIEDDMIYKILFSEGLIGSDFAAENLEDYDTHPSFEEQFIDNIGLNPTEDGQSGNSLFDNYRVARLSIEKGPDAIDIDDISQYEYVISYKMAEIDRLYRKRGSRGKILPKSYEDLKRIQSFLDFPSDNKSFVIEKLDGEKVAFYPANLNINEYLAKLMQERGVLSVEDIIPDRIKKKLKKTTVRIPFPKFYSPSNWRQYALKVLADFAFRNRGADLSSPQYKAVASICMGSAEQNLICGDSDSHKIKNLSNFLAPYRSGENYIPLRKLENDEIGKYWSDLSQIWKKILINKVDELEDSFLTEYEFILGQLRAGNKWAGLRLSYLIAKYYLEAEKNQFEPSFLSSRRGKRPDRPSQKFYRSSESERKRLTTFGEILSLNRVLSPFHGNSVLNEDEKLNIAKNYITERNNQVGGAVDGCAWRAVVAQQRGKR